GARVRRWRARGLVAARDAVCALPEGEGQGEGEGRLQLSGTRRFAWRGALFSFAERSRLHRQFASALVCGAFLPPHPSPLPEERENRTLRFRQSGAPRLVAAGGEGEPCALSAVFSLIQRQQAGGLCYPKTNFRIRS